MIMIHHPPLLQMSCASLPSMLLRCAPIGLNGSTCLRSVAANRALKHRSSLPQRVGNSIPSLSSSLHSFSSESLSHKRQGSDVVELQSTFISRFAARVDRKLCSKNPYRAQVCCRSTLVGLSSSGGTRTEQSGDGRFGGAHAAQLSSRSLQRVVVTQASASAAAAGGGGAAGGGVGARVQNFWYTLWANFCALCASFASRLQSIRIGSLDLLTMLRVVLLAASALGVYVASRRAWVKIQEKAAGKSDGAGGGGASDGEGGDGGPMQVLARGATCLQSNMGPWSMADMTIGLTAIAKLTEKKPPPIPGQEVKDLSTDPNFLLRAQHWRVLSEAAYVKDSASFSLFTSLPESSLVASSWEPCHETFRPAFAVFVDAPYGAVVLSVRGTSHIIDMLLNSGASPEPFGSNGSYAHGGFVHASKMLHKEVLPHIEKAFRDHSGTQKDLKLVIVGHSMGAAVGTLIALTLREQYPDLQCWAFCPPACVSLDLAKECKSFTTSFVAAHDLVPRFSLNSVEKLRTRIQEFDWDEVDKVASDDEDWQNVKKAVDTFKGFQKTQNETMEKLTGGSGGGESETAAKASEIGRQALDSQTGQMVANSLGLDSAALTGGTPQKGDGDGEEGEGRDPEPLHPPGRLLVMGSDPPGCGKMPESRSGVAPERGYGSYPTFDEAKNVTWRMFEAEPEDLVEIVVSPWCISDHMLGNLAEAISYFQSCCPPAIK